MIASPRRRRARTPGVGALLTCLAAVLVTSTTAATDWTSWRGPDQDGHSHETELLGTWSPESGENLLWEADAGARSTPVAMLDRIYVLRLAGEGEQRQESVLCLDTKTGDEVWEYRFNVFLTDIPDTRVGWANPVADPETGYVYAHGVQGILVCLDGADGREVWKRSLTEELGRISGYGGRTHTPVVDEDRLIISFLNSSWGSHSRGSHRYLALDKRTGSVVWWAEPAEGPPLDTTYSCPVVTVVDGVRLLIAGNADGSVYAMKARTGEKVWRFELSKRGLNSSVVARGNLVWVCHSEENIDNTLMGRIVCFDARGEGNITKTHEKWRLDGVTAGYASPALDEDHLYVADNSANVYCIDATRGELAWKHNVGTVMKASPVVADGKLYIGSANGVFSIVEIGEKSAKTLDSEEFLTEDGRVIEINGSACIANGRVYSPTSKKLYCIGAKQWSGESGNVTLPDLLGKESELPASAVPASMLVVPGDVTLYEGQSTFFKARVYDAKGRLIGEVDPTMWSLAGLEGTTDSRGRLTTTAGSGFQQGLVHATHGELTAVARVRVVPRQPIAIDFEDVAVGATPTGWIAATGAKFAVVEHEGSKALKKLAENPKFLLANAYMGLPTWSNYTLQADVLGTETRRQMPNIGLIANRYEMLLLGNHQRVRIVSWSPLPRIEAKERFTWDPDTWYTMKLRVDLQGAKALVRGKVWPRGENEPEEWTITLEDPSPNLEGAPGIQGYSAGTTERSPGAEIYWDNFRITPHEN